MRMAPLRSDCSPHGAQRNAGTAAPGFRFASSGLQGKPCRGSLDIAVLRACAASPWRSAADMLSPEGRRRANSRQQAGIVFWPRPDSPRTGFLHAGHHRLPHAQRRSFHRALDQSDPEIADAIRRELVRQRDEIELIASENIVSRAVLEAQGSVLTNKYAEGLPGKRYYGGCQFVDVVERLAIERVTKLFGCAFANLH